MEILSVAPLCPCWNSMIDDLLVGEINFDMSWCLDIKLQGREVGRNGTRNNTVAVDMRLFS